MQQTSSSGFDDLVGRRRTKRRNTGFAGNHQRCWLWGRHAVLETLRGGRWLPNQIRIASELLSGTQIREVTELAAVHAVPCVEVVSGDLDQLCGRHEHQGLMARMPEFPLADVADTLQQLSTQPAAFVLILDRIQDPFNFGAILRSAEILGAAAVFVADREQATVNSHVVRSSAGAVNHLPIAQTESLPELLRSLQQLEFKVAGASEKANTAPAEVDLTGKLALLIGNEGSGPEPELLEKCDLLLSIPQVGQVASLNAAVAAGILCYEVARQRSMSTNSRKQSPRSS